MFAGSLCLWDPKSKKGRRTRRSQGLAHVCAHIGTQRRWLQAWGVCVCRAGVCTRGARGLCEQRGVYGAGDEGTAPQPSQWHVGWAQGLQGLWLRHIPAGKAAVREEEVEQLPMKHQQVSEVPRGSSALGWQTRRAAVPAPRALQAHGPIGDQVAKDSLGRAGGGSWGCEKCSGPSGDF